MQKLWVISFLIVLGSCNLFTTKEEKIQELVDVKMEEINWNDVDVYPMFANCDEASEKAIQKACFESTFLTHFSKHLTAENFGDEITQGGIMAVHFSIDNTGMISVLSVEKDSAIGTQFPELNDRIAKILTKMPKIAPALKQGIPVRAKFKLPIVLNTL
ncbi:hypothetical protein [Spongiimicrobium salis]|uniref:hypothetical protein n=1 Tax=Spongiimicrobium salis TaxID=1667022 RepID=UPI00374CF368